MKRAHVIYAALIVASSAFAGRTVLSDDEHDKAAQEAAKLAAPGPEHKKLAALVGKFTAKSKLWWEPGKPPVEGTSESENVSVLGGRFIRQSYKGNMMGQPFEGLGYLGYDNLKKKFTSTWMDTASTSAMHTEGEGDGDKIIAKGEVAEPTAGPDKKTKVRTVTTIVSADKHTYELFYTFPGQEQEAKVMEIIYEKKK